MSFMSDSDISLRAFRHKPRIDAGRQEFSVYFDEEGVAYRLEVSAPDHLSFDSVWYNVCHWLKRRGEREWSEENLEFVRKAVDRPVVMSLLQLSKKHGIKITPVEDEEPDQEGLNDEGAGSRINDIGSSLTSLNAEAGVENQDEHYDFRGPSDLESDVGGGVRIRLCNSIFASKAPQEDR